MIATPILLLGLLGLLVWGGLWGWRNLTAPLPSPEPTPCVKRTTDIVVASDVYVRVLNGGYTRGLAERAATHLRDFDYNVFSVGNTDEQVGVTVVRGGEDSQPGMRLVQSHFLDAILEYDDRVDGTIDLLLGTQFAGYNDNHYNEVSSGEDGTACIPASASPSPPQSSEATPPEPTGEATAPEDDGEGAEGEDPEATQEPTDA